MIWLTWRQFRAQGLTVLTLLAAAAAISVGRSCRQVSQIIVPPPCT